MYRKWYSPGANFSSAAHQPSPADCMEMAFAAQAQNRLPASRCRRRPEKLKLNRSIVPNTGHLPFLRRSGRTNVVPRRIERDFRSPGDRHNPHKMDLFLPVKRDLKPNKNPEAVIGCGNVGLNSIKPLRAKMRQLASTCPPSMHAGSGNNGYMAIEILGGVRQFTQRGYWTAALCAVAVLTCAVPSAGVDASAERGC